MLKPMNRRENLGELEIRGEFHLGLPYTRNCILNSGERKGGGQREETRKFPGLGKHQKSLRVF